MHENIKAYKTNVKLKILFKYSIPFSVLPVNYIAKYFFGIEMFLTPSILITFSMFGIVFLATSEKNKKLRYVVGTWLDHCMDRIADALFFKEVNAAELINYLCQGMLDPEISCSNTNRVCIYKGCRRNYCRFGDQEVRTISANDIFKYTDGNININKIRGFKPLNLHLHLYITTSEKEKKEIYFPLQATLYSWSINGCRIKLKGPHNELGNFFRNEAFLVFKPYLLLPTFKKTPVKLKKRIINGEKYLFLDYKIKNPYFKVKKKALTAKKISENNHLKEKLYFCNGNDSQ